jgi:hypothetical protein
MGRATLTARARLPVAWAAVAVLVGINAPAWAQFCWTYVDENTAKAPFRCVEQGDPNRLCSWNGDCHEDLDPNDCCTTVPDSNKSQTVLQMHADWHRCFGDVGDLDGNNPPGRGQRWYAFHRQSEVDFNSWRVDGNRPKIESIDWCPDPTGSLSVLQHEHRGAQRPPPSDPNSHPDGCGRGPNRPGGVACPLCMAFPQCLFLQGGGPTRCPSASLPDCQGNGVTFTYTKLEEFQNVEEVATLLDDWFHAAMHAAVGFADKGLSCNQDPNRSLTDPNSCYVLDALTPTCSPRDPMFWRLHKALDDVVRAWQDTQPVDVVLVMDRSGSIFRSGQQLLTDIKEASRLFADLLSSDPDPNAKKHRIGIVSFAGDASDVSLNLPLTPADPNLLDPNGPFLDVLGDISTGGSGTSIGSGIEAARLMLCPPTGDCTSYTPSAGENSRKAILLITDGLETRAPCLKAACAPGGTGAEIDYAKLAGTQVCAIGASDVPPPNGDLLRLFAERQGGIYMQAGRLPDAVTLAKFFTLCFGQLSSEFLALDPAGNLGTGDPASAPITYASSGDTTLTFIGSWQNAVQPGDLQILISSPSGALVSLGDPTVESSLRSERAFVRISLPYRGEAGGTWRAHLIRPHRTFVNAFTTDGFAAPADGVTLVRREIQRLCPEGCGSVLLFEDGRIGSRSAYQDALDAEVGAGGVVSGYTMAAGANDFAARLSSPWDLIVYAHQVGTRAEPYDASLANLLCSGQRAIVTETRLVPGQQNPILQCAGAEWDGVTNRGVILGDGKLLDGQIALANPGYTIADYGLSPSGGTVQATNDVDLTGDGIPDSGAIVVQAAQGAAQNWSMDVLVNGLSRLDPHSPYSSVRTGEDLLPTVRILPSFVRSGGYDNVDARVEITRPLVGVGTSIAESGLFDPASATGDISDARTAVLEAITIPTTTDTFPLFDDGTHGDLHPGNSYWSTSLPDYATVDGLYQYRFIVELTADGGTTRRELFQSVLVDLTVEPDSKSASLREVNPAPGADRTYALTILPRDRFGNLWGAGRPPAVTCGPVPSCQCDPSQVTDHGQGSYTIRLTTLPGVSFGSCTVNAFGAQFALAGMSLLPPPPSQSIPTLSFMSLLVFFLLLTATGLILIYRKSSCVTPPE